MNCDSPRYNLRRPQTMTPSEKSKCSTSYKTPQKIIEKPVKDKGNNIVVKKEGIDKETLDKKSPVLPSCAEETRDGFEPQGGVEDDPVANRNTNTLVYAPNVASEECITGNANQKADLGNQTSESEEEYGASYDPYLVGLGGSLEASPAEEDCERNPFGETYIIDSDGYCQEWVGPDDVNQQSCQSESSGSKVSEFASTSESTVSSIPSSNTSWSTPRSSRSSRNRRSRRPNSPSRRNKTTTGEPKNKNHSKEDGEAASTSNKVLNIETSKGAKDTLADSKNYSEEEKGGKENASAKISEIENLTDMLGLNMSTSDDDQICDKPDKQEVSLKINDADNNPSSQNENHLKQLKQYINDIASCLTVSQWRSLRKSIDELEMKKAKSLMTHLENLNETVAAAPGNEESELNATSKANSKECSARQKTIQRILRQTKWRKTLPVMKTKKNPKKQQMETPQEGLKTSMVTNKYLLVVPQDACAEYQLNYPNEHESDKRVIKCLLQENLLDNKACYSSHSGVEETGKHYIKTNQKEEEDVSGGVEDEAQSSWNPEQVLWVEDQRSECQDQDIKEEWTGDEFENRSGDFQSNMEQSLKSNEGQVKNHSKGNAEEITRHSSEPKSNEHEKKCVISDLSLLKEFVDFLRFRASPKRLNEKEVMEVFQKNYFSMFTTNKETHSCCCSDPDDELEGIKRLTNLIVKDYLAPRLKRLKYTDTHCCGGCKGRLWVERRENHAHLDCISGQAHNYIAREVDKALSGIEWI